MQNSQVPNLPGVPDVPPTNSQAYSQPAPTAPENSFPMSSSMQGPMQPQQYTLVVQTHPMPPLGPRPCLVTCPSCHRQKLSSLRYETATQTHLFAAVLCLVGCFLCVCIPYFMNTCKNPNHYCSNCNAYLGMYNK